MTLFDRSLAASALIVLTALLRVLAGKRLPRRAFVALWDIAALRLLLPFSIPVRISQKMPFAASTAFRSVLSRSAEQLTQIAATAPGPDVAGALRVLYPLIALTLAAALLLGYARWMSVFSRSTPDRDPRCAAFLRAHPLRRSVSVRTCDAVASPLSYGLFRPVILLSAGDDWRSDDALRFVLLHELWHIRAWDALRKPALLFACCLHFMNPLVYVMFVLASRDIELLCDERVLRACDGMPGAQRAYAKTLLALTTRRIPSPQLNGLCFPSAVLFPSSLEMRIKAMKKTHKKGLFSMILAAALVLASGAALAADVHSFGALPSLSEKEIKAYSVYAPYGLIYDEALCRLTYEGKTVRYFEDMYPVDENGGRAGTVLSLQDGEVDVYAIRDLSGPIERNPDGSFDPSGVLIGLRAATQEEFDAHTRALETPQLVLTATDEVSSQAVFTNVDGEVTTLENVAVDLEPLAFEGNTATIRTDDGAVWTVQCASMAATAEDGTVNFTWTPADDTAQTTKQD